MKMKIKMWDNSPESRRKLGLEKSSDFDDVLASMHARTGLQRLLYSRYLFNIPAYYFLSFVFMLLPAIALVNFSISELILSAIFGYSISQIMFGVIHVYLHASFMERGWNLSKYQPPILIAFLHHYRSTDCMPKNWLIHRLGFIYAGIFNFYVIPWIVPFIFLGWEIFPIYAFFCFFHWLQQLGHDYYHSWDGYHTKVGSYFMGFLEKIGLLDAVHHCKHHEHQDNNMEEHVNWVDFAFPLVEPLAEAIWSHIVKVKDRGGKFLYHARAAVLTTVLVVAIPFSFAYTPALSLIHETVSVLASFVVGLY